MSTAHEKSRAQDEQLREERKTQGEPQPKRGNRPAADHEDNGRVTRNYDGAAGRGGRG